MRVTFFCFLVISPLVIACAQEGSKIAAPIAFSTVEDGLVGPVKETITESLILGGEPRTADWLISIKIYDARGFLVKNGSAKKVDGKLADESLFERTIDRNGLLLATGYDDKKVSYRYESSGGVVRAIPVDASGKAIPYETVYEEKKVGDTISVTASDSNDGTSSIAIYTADGKLLKRTIFDPFSGNKGEMEFADGEIKSTRSSKTHPRPNDKLLTAEYDYDTGYLPTQIRRYENGIPVETDVFEYTVDSRGNWIEYSMYQIDTKKKKRLWAHELRSIVYFE
jgi:hypothetical protein